jgi:hypothetical protein
MAQQFYPIELKGASFPMLSQLQGRTIIGASVGRAPNQDERPGIAYCHNIMPSLEGLNSVAYLPVISPMNPAAVAPFSDVRTAYSTDLARLYLVWDSVGSVFALLAGSTTWVAIPATSPATGGSGFNPDTVTIGTVNGVSYIFYSGIGAFSYNAGTNTLDAVTLTGLAIGSVLGIVESAGYLVSYTDLALAWSSTIDPTDFIPSSVTGAGGGNLAGIAGKIQFIISNTLGLLVFTKANTLAGTFTGNVQFPWKFRPVPDSSGGISLDLVAYEAMGDRQFIFSKAGLQSITSQRAEIMLPEITDFLSGKRFEDFNEVTKLYEVTDITTTMKKKLKFIAARYLVISYGMTSFTHALVIDTALNRIGKLKVEHTDCFEYVDAQIEIAKESMAFLLADGSVSVLDFSAAADSSGVLIMGKLQSSYTRRMNLLGVEVENAAETDVLTVTDQASLDGKNFTNVEGFLAYSNEDVREYVFRSDAKNHSLVFIGKLNAVTLMVRYTATSKR